MSIPQKHINLLEQEIATYHKSEEMSFLSRYEALRPNLRPVGKKLIDEMLLDLDRFVKLITEERDSMSDRQFQVAFAAVKYFIKDADLIDEAQVGLVGLVDDAIVVNAAKRELKDLL